MDKKVLMPRARIHRFAGWLVLCLQLAGSFQPALIVAVLLAHGHGHDHKIVVRADGHHLDLILAHHDEHKAANDRHPRTERNIFPHVTTHDHLEGEHVIHLSRRTAAEQLNSRTGPRTTAPQVVMFPPETLLIPAPTHAGPPATFPPPPANASAITHLSTTVLLI